MVDSLWFVLALVLLAVVSVALVLVAGGGALRTRDPHRVSTAQLWGDRRVPRLVRALQ